MNDFRVRTKIWLEIDGRPFLGGGRCRLLEAVARCGSINAAAKELGLSYRKAWAQLKAMEEAAPFPLLERRVGGQNGGASRLTPQARDLMQRYHTLCRRLTVDADRCFAEHFCRGEDSC